MAIKTDGSVEMLRKIFFPNENKTVVFGAIRRRRRLIALLFTGDAVSSTDNEVQRMKVTNNMT